MRAAQAAHARARAECLRAMRSARKASDGQRVVEESRLSRRSAPTSRPASKVAERRLSRLRARELEVMILLAAGLQTREVADALFITDQTVRTHVKLALRHGGVHSREELFKLLESARATDTVQLATMRVRPFLDKWWVTNAPRGESPILRSEGLPVLD